MTDIESSNKPRVEVAEDITETLEVLDLDRLPRDQKMAAERAYLADAHEVAYMERAFMPRHAAPIDEIRQTVDGLERRATEFPEAAPRPAPLPIAEPEPEPVHIPEMMRTAIEPLVGHTLTSAELVHSDMAGEVVDAGWEADGKRQTGLFIVRDGKASPFDDIAARVDSLPAPALETPEPTPDEPSAPEPEAETAAEPAKKKRRFGFGKKDNPPAKTTPEVPKEEAADEASDEPASPKKKRFSFGRK